MQPARAALRRGACGPQPHRINTKRVAAWPAYKLAIQGTLCFDPMRLRATSATPTGGTCWLQSDHPGRWEGRCGVGRVLLLGQLRCCRGLIQVLQPLLHTALQVNLWAVRAAAPTVGRNGATHSKPPGSATRVQPMAHLWAALARKRWSQLDNGPCVHCTSVSGPALTCPSGSARAHGRHGASTHRQRTSPPWPREPCAVRPPPPRPAATSCSPPGGGRLSRAPHGTRDTRHAWDGKET